MSQLQSASVIARCPLRISFAGGGSDNDWFTQHQPGAVLSGAVCSYVHARVTAAAGDEPAYGILNADPLSTSLTSGGTLLHEHAWDWFKSTYDLPANVNVSIATASDVPRGSGLGASSALMVAILGGLYGYFEIAVTRSDVARAAHFVERELAGVAGGYQDHYAAAHGSLNFITFMRGGEATVDPLHLSPERLAALESRLTLIFSGTTRESAAIISTQYANLADGREDVLQAVARMVDLAKQSRDSLLLDDLDSFSRHVRDAAENKRSASPASYTQDVSHLADAALSAGADVCKVSGAGGGGFLLAISRPQLKPLVEARLWELGYQPRNVTFDHTGLLVWRE